MPTLSEVQAAQAAALTDAYKVRQNREAARMAALVALLYQRQVDPTSLPSVERWLDIVVPRLVAASDNGAISAAQFFTAIRRIEGVNDSFRPEPTRGVVDPGVRKSLLTVGPYDFTNKATQIERLDLAPAARAAALAEAKQATVKKVAAATIRHAQAGARQTIVDNTERDEVALGWVRVTKADPCFFCAMLASRGISYRAFREDSFAQSDPRFSGDGTAKVHDNCGCSVKPVYAENDPLLDRTRDFAEMWSMWGAGGGEAALRFRRGYEHFRRTGDYLTFEQANEGPRAA